MGQTGAWGSTTREAEGVLVIDPAKIWGVGRRRDPPSSCNNDYFEIPPPHSSGAECHWLYWGLPSVQDTFMEVSILLSGSPLYVRCIYCSLPSTQDALFGVSPHLSGSPLYIKCFYWGLSFMGGLPSTQDMFIRVSPLLLGSPLHVRPVYRGLPST